MKVDSRQLNLFDRPPRQAPRSESRAARRARIHRDEKHQALQELARWWRSRR